MAPVGHGLADTYRLLEPFQRRSGDKPLSVAGHVEDLHEFLDFYARDSSTVLLGSSWGAMLALAYAAAYPTSVASLILVGCGTFDPVARAHMQETLARRMTDEVRQQLECASRLPNADERLRAAIEAEIMLYAYEPLASPVDEVVDEQAHKETWEDMLRLQAEKIYPAAFASIQMPVLMVHGTFDPHPGRLIQASLQSYMPQLDYRELENCGHWPWLEKSASDGFFLLIKQWLGHHKTDS